MKQILFISIMSLLITSCGKKAENQDKEAETAAQEVKVNPNTFKIEVEGIWKENDELIVFWKDASISYFNDDHTIYQGIKGSDMPQKVVFELEEGFIPNDIRFDVSSKKEQKEIVLKYIKLEQQDRSFVISKDELTDFFRPNEFIDFDKASGKITTKTIDGVYDPILFTTPRIYVEMEKVLMTKF